MKLIFSDNRSVLLSPPLFERLSLFHAWSLLGFFSLALATLLSPCTAMTMFYWFLARKHLVAFFARQQIALFPVSPWCSIGYEIQAFLGYNPCASLVLQKALESSLGGCKRAQLELNCFETLTLRNTIGRPHRPIATIPISVSIIVN